MEKFQKVQILGLIQFPTEGSLAPLENLELTLTVLCVLCAKTKRGLGEVYSGPCWLELVALEKVHSAPL